MILDGGFERVRRVQAPSHVSGVEASLEETLAYRSQEQRDAREVVNLAAVPAVQVRTPHRWGESEQSPVASAEHRAVPKRSDRHPRDPPE